MKVFCLFSRDKDVCVKVVILAKINKCDPSSRRLVWLFSSSRWRVNQRSGCTTATTSPLNVSSWKPGAEELPSCSSGSRTRSHFTQCTKTGSPHTPSSPHTLSLHQSAHSSLSAFFSHSLSFPPLFLPSGDTPTHWAEPVPLDLCCSGTSCRGSGGRRLAQLTQHSCLFPVIKNETLFFRNAKTNR